MIHPLHLVVALGFLFCSWTGCNLLEPAQNELDIVNQLGTVEQFGIREGQFAIRPDVNADIAYLPLTPLPEEFATPGLRVVFSGNVKPFPEDPIHDPTYPLIDVNSIARAKEGV